MKGKQNMTIFEHMVELIQNSEDADTKFYGLTPEEILKSPAKKLSIGWKILLKKDYENSRTSIHNIFTHEDVECPSWFKNFYEDMLYTCMLQKNLTDEEIALFDFIKFALLLDDSETYFKLVD